MTVAIYHYVKPGKEAWKLFLLTLKARLFENMTSQASVPHTPESAASVVESLGDAALLTEEEVTTSQCCTCHKPIDKDNSLVIVRAGLKSSNEIRRCRACHSMRSAIERLKRNHGNLVKDFTSADGDRISSFYRENPHLRGEDLRKRLEEIVQDWKISITRYEFNQEADFVEESDIRAKYADKPEIAENILKNSRSFFCPIKKVILYADPKYQAKGFCMTPRMPKLQRDQRRPTRMARMVILPTSPSSKREKRKRSQRRLSNFLPRSCK